MSAAYLDTSALVKLMWPEPQTDALVDALGGWSMRIASEVALVELSCTVGRVGAAEAVTSVEAIAAGLYVVPFSTSVREWAVKTALRSSLSALDAIHLATARGLRSDLDAFVAYGQDLCEEAAAYRLPVVSPS